MNLGTFLKIHSNDYVCLNTPYWRKTALGSELYEALDDIWLCQFPTVIDEDGADDYDVYVFVN